MAPQPPFPLSYMKVFDCWECNKNTPQKDGFTMPIKANELGNYRIIGICGKCFANYSKIFQDYYRHNPTNGK